MSRFATLGNDLYTGRRSLDVVRQRRFWYAVSLALVALSVVLLLTRGLNAGIEFRGGSEFRVSDVADTSSLLGQDAVATVTPDAEAARVSTVGGDSVRVQTERLDREQTAEVGGALAEAYGVSPSAVTSSFVGPTWGQDVTRQALIALGTFLVLAGLVLAAYFRTWRMSVVALVALVHDVVITAGIYSLSGLEVTPSTVIGFLTILGYSLYDTVVVFDKIRENTAHVLSGSRLTYAQAVNLAVNQTLVRSINTTVVALLPVGAILFVGALLLGAGTLTDIALALFVGMLAGAYSSVFLAPALYVQLMERRPDVAEHTARVLAARADGTGAVTGRSRTASSGGSAVSGSLLGSGRREGPGGRSGAGTAVLERDDAGPGPGPGPEPTAPADGAGERAPGRAAVRATRGPRNQPARKPGTRRR